MTEQRWELKLPYIKPPLSLNDRKHWTVQVKEKGALKEAVCWLAKAAKMPKLAHAAIWLEWTPATKRRRDTDNIEATRKVCVDALVSTALRLPDDTPEFVARPENVIHEPQRGMPSLVLVIEGVPATRGAA